MEAAFLLGIIGVAVLVLVMPLWAAWVIFRHNSASAAPDRAALLLLVRRSPLVLQ